MRHLAFQCRYGIAAFALATLTIQSCKQPDELVSQQQGVSTVTDHNDTKALASFLSSELGIATSQIVYQDTINAFVVEKDMLVSKADAQARMKAGIGAKTTQRRAKWLLSDAVVQTLGVSIDDNFPLEWKQAFQDVALAWNYDNPRIKFYITSNNPKVKLKTYFSGKNDLSYIVKAPLPAHDGNVGGEVLVNYNYCYYGPQISMAMKKAAIVHALGHVIGLTHTNPDGSYDDMYIPGTPTTDNASVMKGCFMPWTSLSWGDWMAARFLYPSNTSWGSLGYGIDVAAGGGADASLWKVGNVQLPKGYTVHRLNWPTRTWEQIPTIGAVRIAVSPVTELPWIVDNQGDIYRLRANHTWEQVPGKASDIGIGANGDVWVVSKTVVQGGYSIHKWNNGTWARKVGGAKTITVAPDGNPWIINVTGQIYRYNGDRFVEMPGAGLDIAASTDGYIYITGLKNSSGGHPIYRWQGNGWIQLGGSGVNIAALEVPYDPVRNQSFHISIDEPVTASIQLYDAKGSSIGFTRKPDGTQTVLITPLRPLAAGTYTIVAHERATKRTFNLTVLQ